MVSHPLVEGVRYNAGYRSAYPPEETLRRIFALARHYGKKAWVDLDCRQLRITHWADPAYGEIALNHEIEVDLPATVIFRGGGASQIKVVRKNVIYVDPPPREAVGEGQAVNIHGENLHVHGFLTQDCRAYIAAACQLGNCNFMLSFVEEAADIAEVLDIVGDRPVELVLKIESQRGLQFIDNMDASTLASCQLMAARDDLTANIGENKALMLPALQRIVTVDPNAICASRLFCGIERDGAVSLADFSDLRLMQQLGYRHFMLSDGICHHHFDEAVKAWEDFHAACQTL